MSLLDTISSIIVRNFKSGVVKRMVNKSGIWDMGWEIWDAGCENMYKNRTSPKGKIALKSDRMHMSKSNEMSTAQLLNSLTPLASPCPFLS